MHIVFIFKLGLDAFKLLKKYVEIKSKCAILLLKKLLSHLRGEMSA